MSRTVDLPSHDELDDLAERLERYCGPTVGTAPARGALVVSAAQTEALLAQLDDRIVGQKEAADALGVDVSTLWRWRKEAGFPTPVCKVSGQDGWSLREVRAWSRSAGD